MPRPIWSGTIQISLVGLAVEIYPATSATRPVSFHEIDRKTMARVHHQNVTAGPAPEEEPADGEEPEESQTSAAGKKTSLHLAPKAAAPVSDRTSEEEPDQHAVSKTDIVKGYEYEKGKYAVVEPEELKNLRLAGKKTVELSQFARASEISPALYDKPYFVVPKAGPPATAFSVIRQSMIDSGMVGVGEIVFSGRQRLITLAAPHDPHQPGMMLYTLRFATELRDAKDVFKGTQDFAADTAQLALARQLIDAYTQPFEAGKFQDHYADALRELVDAKINNLPLPTAEPEKKPGKVIDLMDALRRSISQRNPSQAADSGARTDADSNKTKPRKSQAKAARKRASA